MTPPSGPPDPAAAGPPAADPRFEAGVAAFDRGDYFEAHELWEELWRDASPADRLFYKGLIQLAVACHHRGRGNRSGADRLYHSARRYLEPYRPAYGTIDLDRLLAAMERAWTAATAPLPALPRAAPAGGS